MKDIKIVAINLGSTSTKVAYYFNDTCEWKENIVHPAEELKGFATIWDQYDYRMEVITRFLKERGLQIEELDAVVSRGGHTRPIVGGVYRINEVMLADSASEKYGNHATDLGLRLAYGLSKQGPQAFTVDPPTTDEFEPLARYSGLPELPRRSSFHILNHRAVGKQYAADAGRNYADLNLVVAHMGGGITVAAHKLGKLVDANNGIDGDGPFSTNRCCSVPVGALVKMCFSGEYTHEQIRKKLNDNGGMMAYLGENDVKTVSERAAAGDETCAEVLDAMCYQTSKEIAACAAVLCGKVDAILLTGGIAYNQRIVSYIREHVEFIAPVMAYPGEYEMQSLGLNALAALRGEEEIKEMQEER